MNKLRKAQQGAVMLETAYVLPLLVGVILFIVETLSFAMNSLLVNDVLTDVHLKIVDEVQEISALDNASGYVGTFGLTCDGGKVTLPPGDNETMTTLALDGLNSRGVSMMSTHPGLVNVSIQQDSNNYGFDLYVIRFSGTANALTLPDFLNELLPIDVDTVISIKASCKTD